MTHTILFAADTADNVEHFIIFTGFLPILLLAAKSIVLSQLQSEASAVILRIHSLRLVRPAFVLLGLYKPSRLCDTITTTLS